MQRSGRCQRLLGGNFDRRCYGVTVPKDPAVTLKDVARHAGVSRTTASLALSGGGRISQATRDRVRAAARDLRYEVHVGARNLRKERSGAVGLLLPRHTSSLAYYMEVAFGAVDAAQRGELSVTLVSSRQAEQAPGSLLVDGFLLVDPLADDPAVAALLEDRRPVVSGEDVPPELPAPAATVSSDHRRGTRLLLDHLAEQGAGRPALVAPGPSSSWGRALREAHRDWCRERGIEPGVAEVPFAATADDMARATRELLGRADAPDALVAAPDGGALAAVTAAREMGRRPGEDLLVASCVDSTALRLSSPQITALDLHPRTLGAEGLRALLDVLENGAPSDPGPAARIPIDLRVRASTCAEA